MSPKTAPVEKPQPLDEVFHSPADCALVFAIPTRKVEFDRGLDSRDRDFVRSLMRSNPGRSVAQVWADYAPLAAYACDLADEARLAGALAGLDASFACWSQMLRERPVVVLFAHCRQGTPDAIEFADGLHTADDVAAAVPADFSGVLDLTVCYSLQLAAGIKVRAPRSQLVSNKYETALDERLAILRQVLRLTAFGGYSYPGAMAAIRLALLQGGKRQ